MTIYNTDDFSNEDLIHNDLSLDVDVDRLDGYSFEEEDDAYIAEIDRLLVQDNILDLAEYLDDDEIESVLYRINQEI